MDHRADCQLLTVETYGLCTCDLNDRVLAEKDKLLFGRCVYRELPNGYIEHIPLKDVFIVDNQKP